MGMKLVRILVVHRQRIVAESLARRLDCEDAFSVVDVETGEPSVLSRVDTLGPDVAILEVAAEHERAATELCRGFVDRVPPVRVVAIVEHDDPEVVSRIIRAGADGVTTADDEIDNLIAAVQAVALGEAWVQSRLLPGVLREFRESRPPLNEYDRRIALLTARERDVLHRMVAGWDHATIARDLVVSINTVRTHSQRILSKLEVHSGLEAVSVFRQSSGGHGTSWSSSADS
jgi:DNA-binding NarL/FixJ family response regulator